MLAGTRSTLSPIVVKSQTTQFDEWFIWSSQKVERAIERERDREIEIELNRMND